MNFLYQISKVFRWVKSDLASSSEESDRCEEFIGFSQSDEPELFTQAELNELVSELDPPKSSAELLGTRLKEKNLLTPETKVCFYRYREKGFIEFF